MSFSNHENAKQVPLLKLRSLLCFLWSYELVTFFVVNSAFLGPHILSRIICNNDLHGNASGDYCLLRVCVHACVSVFARVRVCVCVFL